MEENDVDEEEMMLVVKIVCYLGKQIKDLAKKNEAKVMAAASLIFDPNAIVTQPVTLLNQLTTVASAPTGNVQMTSTSQVLSAQTMQTVQQPNLTISATPPLYQLMTPITTPSNHPQAMAPHAMPSRSILKPKYAFDASVYHAGAVELSRISDYIKKGL